MEFELNIFRYAVIFLIGLNALLLLWPRLIVYVYLGLIFLIPNTLAMGVKKGVEYQEFYGAGTGMLVRPLISFYLLFIFAVSLIFFKNNKVKISKCIPLYILSLLSVYYILYAIIGMTIEIPIEEIVNGHSAIHIVDMTLLLFIMLRFCSTKEEFIRFSLFIILCVFTRESYGLIRYIFFEGDFSNVYLNIEKINIKLTFQDINDSFLACVVGFYCAWELLYNKIRISFSTKIIYLLIVGMSFFIIMFSYRRSAWIGLCLAAAYFVLRQPFRRQLQVGIVVLAISTIIFGFLITARLGQHENSRSTLLFYDVSDKRGKITMKSGRFTELTRGIQTIKNNALSGVGPWGTIDYSGSRDFMHGGLLQIWLKLGFPGFALFIFAILAFLVFCLSKSRVLEPENRGWFEAGFAGILFMIPTLCFGTPVIEYRTMQLLALCMALPYITFAMYKVPREGTIAQEAITCSELAPKRIDFSRSES